MEEKQNIYEKMVKESQGKRINRAKAIRYKCLDCCSFQSNEVRDCSSMTCPLWRYRMGTEVKDELYHDSHQKKEGDTDV